MNALSVSVTMAVSAEGVGRKWAGSDYKQGYNPRSQCRGRLKLRRADDARKGGVSHSLRAVLALRCHGELGIGEREGEGGLEDLRW